MVIAVAHLAYARTQKGATAFWVLKAACIFTCSFFREKDTSSGVCLSLRSMILSEMTGIFSDKRNILYYEKILGIRLYNIDIYDFVM